MSELSLSMNLDPTEESMITKIIKTLEEKTRLVKDQTTVMDVKAEELARARADLQETEVLKLRFKF